MVRNNITTLQNEPHQLKRLAAQRQLYSRAKRILLWQLIAAVPVTIALAILANAFPATKVYVSCWGIGLFLLDLFVLMPVQKQLREDAAGIQELFDCDVLQLPYSVVKGKPQIDPELISEQSRKYPAEKMPTVENWYPAAIAELPLSIGRIVCQRTNCWWDSQQRRKFVTAVTVFLVAVFLLLLAMALPYGLTMEDFLLQVLFPLAPLFFIGLRQIYEQKEAAKRLDKLKLFCNKLWEEALAGQDDEELTHRSRCLQDEIYNNRRQSPLFPDKVYSYFQQQYELDMNISAETYLAEAKSSLGL